MYTCGCVSLAKVSSRKVAIAHALTTRCTRVPHVVHASDDASAYIRRLPHNHGSLPQDISPPSDCCPPTHTMSSVSSQSHGRSESRSVLSPLAYGTTPGSIFGTLDNSPDVLMVNETLRDIGASLANFEVCTLSLMLGGKRRAIALTGLTSQKVFDSLGQQNSQMIQMGGELETTQHLNKYVLMLRISLHLHNILRNHKDPQ